MAGRCGCEFHACADLWSAGIVGFGEHHCVARRRLGENLPRLDRNHSLFRKVITMKAARLLTFCSVLLFMVFAPGKAAFAQSGGSYIFPGITTNNDITIGNLNPQPTTATISFYDSSGKLSSLSVELASGAQTRVNPNTVGLTSFTGSVVVSGPVPLTVS